MRVWEADSGRQVLPPLWHGDGVRSVEFSPDGTQLVTAGLDFSVRVWDARSGRLLQRLHHNSKPVYAAFSPSGRHIVTACYDGTERVWALRGFTPKPSPVVFSGNGACFASMTNQTIQIFDAAGGQPLGSVPTPHLQLLRVLLNRDGSRLLTLAEPASGSPSDTLQAALWDCKTGLGIGRSVVLDRTSTNLVFSPNGHQVFAFAQGRVTVWDFDRNREVLGLPLEGSGGRYGRVGLPSSQPANGWPWPFPPTFRSGTSPVANPSCPPRCPTAPGWIAWAGVPMLDTLSRPARSLVLTLNMLRCGIRSPPSLSAPI